MKTTPLTRLGMEGRLQPAGHHGPALTTHLVELVDRVNQVFSDDNVRSFKATFDNARLSSERLPGAIRDVQQMVADVRSTSQEVQGAAAAFAQPETESFAAHL